MSGSSLDVTTTAWRDTLDQMAVIVRGMNGKRLMYRDLIVHNDLASGVRNAERRHWHRRGCGMKCKICGHQAISEIDKSEK